MSREENDPAGSASGSQQPQPGPSWLPSVPAPIKRVFDQFPLTTYPPNALPSRSSRQTNDHTLYIFTDARGATLGAPSFNPQCLKWQAYLRFSGVSFRTVNSTNHASPTGSLPYLLPAGSLTPVSSNKLQKWVSSQPMAHQSEDDEEQANLRYVPYMSLIDHRIRRAWLYTLYLHEQNFTSVARRLYVDPSTSNALVRLTLSLQLQHAAQTEIHKGSSSISSLVSTSAYIDVDDILAEANKAFEALSTLLGDDTYFFGKPIPGLFDASVFAYTHLILDERMGWKEDLLGRYLRRYENLVEHREGLKRAYFENKRK